MTFVEIIEGYAVEPQNVGSRLMVVAAADQVIDQLRVTGVIDLIGEHTIYPFDELLGATLGRASADAEDWVSSQGDGDRLDRAGRGTQPVMSTSTAGREARRAAAGPP